MTRPPTAPQGRYALVGETLTPHGRKRAVVVVKGKQIERVIDLQKNPKPSGQPKERRAVDGLIAPGFIDVQTNGAFGKDVMTDRDAISAMKQALPKTGVTAFLPTVICSPMSIYRDMFRRLEAAEDVRGATPLGLHLEGPFFAPPRAGMHDRKNLREVDLGFIDEMVSRGPVKMMTLAPELAGAPEAVARLREHGVVPSAGHTDATFAQAKESIASGLAMGTHLFNRMAGNVDYRGKVPEGTLQKQDAPDAGMVGALLTDERTRAGIIADGIHIWPQALKMAFEAKGPEGLALVTDAFAPAGMPEGTVLHTGGQPVQVKDGAVRLVEGDVGRLSGSALTMDQAVRNAKKLMGATEDEAIRMASQTPAEILDLPNKGQVKPGADADLVVLSQDGKLRVQETIVAGETVFRSATHAT